MYVGSGTSKLHHAIKTLRAHWDDSEDGWRDANRQEFERKRIEPLDSQAQSTLRAMQTPLRRPVARLPGMLLSHDHPARPPPRFPPQRANRTRGPASSPPGASLPGHIARLSADARAGRGRLPQGVRGPGPPAESALREAAEAADHGPRHPFGRGRRRGRRPAPEATTEFETESAQIEAERQNVRRTSQARYRRTRDEATTTDESARWEAGTMLEAAEKGAAEWKKESEARLADEVQAVEQLKSEVESHLAGRFGRLAPPRPRPSHPPRGARRSVPGPPRDDRGGRPEGPGAAKAEAGQRLPRGPDRLALPPAGAGLGLSRVAPAGPPFWPHRGRGPGGGIGVGLSLAVVLASRAHVAALMTPLRADLRAGRLAHRGSPVVRAGDLPPAEADATERRDRESKKAEVEFLRVTEEATQRRDEKIGESESLAAAHLSEARSRKDVRLRQADETEAHRAREIAETHAREVEAANRARVSSLDEAETRRRADWQRLADAGRRAGTASEPRSPRSGGDRPEVPRPVRPRRLVAPPDAPDDPSHRRGPIDPGASRGALGDEVGLARWPPMALDLPALLAFPEQPRSPSSTPARTAASAAVEG